MHPIKAIRQAVTTRLQTASIAIDVGGVSTSCSVLDHPPVGVVLPDESLPGIYVFIRDEQIEPSDLRNADDRSYLIDVVLQARGDQIDAVDQIDEMHLAVEEAIVVDPKLGGLCIYCLPVSSTMQVDRAEMTFAARRVTFRALRRVVRGAPAVT